jgi:hypothetical protein
MLRPDLSGSEKLDWFFGSLFENRSSCDPQLAGEIWTDPELVTNTCDVLTRLLGGLLPSTAIDEFMTPGERSRLSELPDEVRLFRGHVPVLEHRPSWTINPIVALDWALLRIDKLSKFEIENPAEPVVQFCLPMVTIGTALKEHIVAFVDRRGEDEILIHPQHVTDRRSFLVTCDERESTESN